MARPSALVLDGITLTGLVQRVLHGHERPSTIIVCGSKEAFLEQLRVESSTTNVPQLDQDVVDAQSDCEALIQAKSSGQRQTWRIPTLRQLFTSRTVKLAFCPDITHLRAYLSNYATRLQTHDGSAGAHPAGGKRILAVLNSIQLHRPTSAYSAQGLNRSFAAAVEAAHHSGSHLLIAECVPPGPSNDADIEQTIESYRASDEPEGAPPSSTWDEEVSILNVTTKSFGVGERGWVGRTVRLRTIAQRWCAFEDCRPAWNAP